VTTKLNALKAFSRYFENMLNTSKNLLIESLSYKSQTYNQEKERNLKLLFYLYYPLRERTRKCLSHQMIWDEVILNNMVVLFRKIQPILETKT